MLPQKCGTSTLQLRFKDIHDLKEFGGAPAYNKELDKLLTKHIELKHARRLDAYKSRSSYTKACFVRNPYDRIYSWFLWTIRHNQKELEKLSSESASHSVDPHTGLSEAKRLEDALDMKKRLEEADYDFNQFFHAKPKRFNLATDFTHYKGTCHVDFIGHMETFEEDFDRLCRLIDYEPKHRKNLNQSNTTKSPEKGPMVYPEYISHFSAKTIFWVNRIHARDFKYLGYKKVSPLRYLLKHPG